MLASVCPVGCPTRDSEERDSGDQTGAGGSSHVGGIHAGGAGQLPTPLRLVCTVVMFVYRLEAFITCTLLFE